MRTRVKQIHELAPTDRAYPALLAEAPRPPDPLYVRGDPDVLGKTLVAIVGTRRPTDEALLFSKLLVETLNRLPSIVTVSGLAFGIDATVHRAAIEGGRPTIAVLASGVDRPTPTSHARLARELLDAGGCLVSGFPPGTDARRQRFPQRNWIIAGLAGATLVVEAGEPSGALLTASAALELNREVLAVPASPLNPSALGSNALLKQGARPVTEPADLLDALGHETPARLARRDDDPITTRVLAALDAPRTVDHLSEACTIPLARLSSVLSLLELDGRVRTLGDGRVVRTDVNDPNTS